MLSVMTDTTEDRDERDMLGRTPAEAMADPENGPADTYLKADWAD